MDSLRTLQTDHIIDIELVVLGHFDNAGEHGHGDEGRGDIRIALLAVWRSQRRQVEGQRLVARRGVVRHGSAARGGGSRRPSSTHRQVHGRFWRRRVAQTLPPLAREEAGLLLQLLKETVGLRQLGEKVCRR